MADNNQNPRANSGSIITWQPYFLIGTLFPLRNCLSFLTLAIGLVSCASSPVGHGVAADEFYRLGPGGKKVANEFYNYGVSDEVKNLYWAQRRLQEPGYNDQRPPLQRKYVTVWVPEQKQPDGAIVEGHYKVVEVVE